MNSIIQMGFRQRSTVDGGSPLRNRARDNPQHRHSPDAPHVHQDSPLSSGGSDAPFPTVISQVGEGLRRAHPSDLCSNVPEVRRTIDHSWRHQTMPVQIGSSLRSPSSGYLNKQWVYLIRGLNSVRGSSTLLRFKLYRQKAHTTSSICCIFHKIYEILSSRMLTILLLHFWWLAFFEHSVICSPVFVTLLFMTDWPSIDIHYDLSIFYTEALSSITYATSVYIRFFAIPSFCNVVNLVWSDWRPKCKTNSKLHLCKQNKSWIFVCKFKFEFVFEFEFVWKMTQ